MLIKTSTSTDTIISSGLSWNGKRLLTKYIRRHLRSIFQFVILNMELFVGLPPCASIKVAVRALLKRSLLLGGLHPRCTRDPQPFLLVIAPVPAVP